MYQERLSNKFRQPHNVGVLPEHRLRIDSKGSTGFKNGELLHGAEIEVV